MTNNSIAATFPNVERFVVKLPSLINISAWFPRVEKSIDIESILVLVFHDLSSQKFSLRLHELNHASLYSVFL